MKNNNKLGAVLAVLGIVAGLLAFYLIASHARKGPVATANALAQEGRV